MGPFTFLLASYNIPFLLALAASLIFAALQIFSGGDSDTDADVDADVDVDADIDADIDVDADAGIDTHMDIHGDAAPAASGGDGGSLAQSMLAALGIGRVPIMLVLMAFLISFGSVGLLSNTTLTELLGRYPDLAIYPTLLGSGILALFITSSVSRLLAQLAPNSSTAISLEQLVGRVGVVVSSSVSQTYGRVQVRDSFGSLHTVYAIIEEGDPVPDQSEVALLAYDAAQRRFVVRAMNRG